MLRFLLTGWAAALFSISVMAQSPVYSVANAHSHNDYENPIPFLTAYHEGFGSIEADIWLVGDSLLVGHDKKELEKHRSLDEYYLKPLSSFMRSLGGRPFPDSTRSLQMLIELKSDAVPTLDNLVQALEKYPLLTHSPLVRWTITGNRPSPDSFTTYPPYIWFDGELPNTYSPAALSRIAMLSDDCRRYSTWSGKSNIPALEKARLEAAIAKAHQLHKPVRFWDAPDEINAWYQFMQLGVDYINTDHITALSAFLQGLPHTTYKAGDPYSLYKPTYHSDGGTGKARRVILLIGDGMGLAELYSGYTANRGALNIFSMRVVGLSKTASADSYITDSAPGSTSIASGVKTNNRYVGVDPEGHYLPLLPAILKKKHIRTGLITAGDVTDATPADFYAHRAGRDSSRAIFLDLASAPVYTLMGSGSEAYDSSIARILNSHGYNTVSSIDSVKAVPGKKWLVMQDQAGLSMLQGRGDWLQRAMEKTIGALSQSPDDNKTGFFIMAEGAQVDYGGHKNDLPYVTSEVLDFDRLVGAALKFADEDGETLVVVTADHETGGLSLLDGDFSKGYVGGQFSTHDHSAIPVPVFAYGPGSQLFEGVYENTALFGKILKAYGFSMGAPNAVPNQ